MFIFVFLESVIVAKRSNNLETVIGRSVRLFAQPKVKLGTINQKIVADSCNRQI